MKGWRTIWVQLEPITGDVCGFACGPLQVEGFPNPATEFVPSAAVQDVLNEVGQVCDFYERKHGDVMHVRRILEDIRSVLDEANK